MLNKLNQADLQIGFTKATELKALSNIDSYTACTWYTDWINFDFVYANGISEAFVHQY